MPNVRAILRENVLSLLKRRTGELRGNESGVSRLKSLGVTHGTAQRALDGSTSIGIALLAELAAALDVQPWQLLVPGLDPNELPTLGTRAWPLTLIDESEYRALSPEGRAFAQGAMATAMGSIAKKRSSA